VKLKILSILLLFFFAAYIHACENCTCQSCVKEWRSAYIKLWHSNYNIVLLDFETAITKLKAEGNIGITNKIVKLKRKYIAASEQINKLKIKNCKFSEDSYSKISEYQIAVAYFFLDYPNLEDWFKKSGNLSRDNGVAGSLSSVSQFGFVCGKCEYAGREYQKGTLLKISGITKYCHESSNSRGWIHIPKPGTVGYPVNGIGFSKTVEP